jgi:polyisoprenoid-binding protein YceI
LLITPGMETERWEVDSARSVIAFSLPAGARGRFTRWTATMYAEGGELSRGRVEVMIDASSVECGAVDRDAMAAGLLDAPNHPEIRFRSTHVKVLKRDRLRIAGELAIRGVARGSCCS